MFNPSYRKTCEGYNYPCDACYSSNCADRKCEPTIFNCPMCGEPSPTRIGLCNSCLKEQEEEGRSYN